ncbi:MAG: glycosyltransferase [Acidimicrobiia bacterium]
MIPTFNGAAHLGEQLEALTRQRRAPQFEVVVADNGSTDQTRAVAETFGDRLHLRIVDASAQRGQTFARNTGAATSSAQSLLFLDQDDVVADDYVAQMHRALEQHQFVAARMETDRLNAGWIARARDIAQTKGLGVEPAPWAYGCSLGIRRSTFEQVGGFDPELRQAGEDVDLCWRLASAGVDLVFVPEAVLHYRFPTTKRAFFRQGRTYGRAAIAVDRRHESRAQSPSAFSWLRSFAGAVRLALFARDQGSRARGLFLLGRRLGVLEGVTRRRLGRAPY